MTSPTPLFMPPKQTAKTARPVITADLDELADAVITGPVRPGLQETVVVTQHDGVIKAKNAEKGQVVRAFLHGQPRGGERVIDTVERIEDGAMVRITFSSPHPTTDYKAAYRFYVSALDGVEVKVVEQVPALVPYEES